MPERASGSRAERERMRIFLAVFPSAAAQAAAADAIEKLRRPGDAVSWVRQDNLHYTLRFLGDLGEDGCRRAALAAHDAARAHASFDAALGPLGAFPKPERARVLWVGLSAGAEPFVAMARDLEHALRQRGFDRADRPFAPHLTIGRVRDRDQDWSLPLADLVIDPPVRFRVDRIAVVHSTLSPKGSIYRVREEVALGGG
ncbi:MAG TPA: RNA 2',3'-cyclic phosphodiesterase [Candidatus Limnocylindria bacterium]|nr:RNA 2',3'-cyclic phosphodiesterase [Candidatus Limnocylindria bacterium]